MQLAPEEQEVTPLELNVTKPTIARMIDDLQKALVKETGLDVYVTYGIGGFDQVSHIIFTFPSLVDDDDDEDEGEDVED